MSLALHIAAAISAIVGSTLSVELLLDRYATPEARNQAEAFAPQRSIGHDQAP